MGRVNSCLGRLIVAAAVSLRIGAAAGGIAPAHAEAGGPMFMVTSTVGEGREDLGRPKFSLPLGAENEMQVDMGRGKVGGRVGFRVKVQTDPKNKAGFVGTLTARIDGKDVAEQVMPFRFDEAKWFGIDVGAIKWSVAITRVPPPPR